MSGVADALADAPVARSVPAIGVEMAMVLAAGLGERMRPLTLAVPKPLLPLAGKPLIEHALDRLGECGIATAVVNLHYLGHSLEQRLERREHPTVLFSRETELLETGGGVKAALPLLGERPFFAINGDSFWLDGHIPSLRRLATQWDEARMDALLLLHPTTLAIGYGGVGDFLLGADGRVQRRGEREVAPFVYTGILLAHPRFYARGPEGAFSTNLLFDRAIEAGRLFGIRHDGEWFHIGTPEALAETEAILASRDFPSERK